MTVDMNALVTDKEVISKKITIKDLKIQLELRKLRKSGNKKDLIERLLQAIALSDRAANDRVASTAINQVENNLAPNNATNHEKMTLCQPCQV